MLIEILTHLPELLRLAARPRASSARRSRRDAFAWTWSTCATSRRIATARSTTSRTAAVAGMVMMAPVLAAAIEARRDAPGLPRGWTVLMTPDGRPFDHALGGASSPGARGRALLVCGRYEGIDERVRDLGLYDEEISLGDFVLPGGESAALAVTEAAVAAGAGGRRSGRVARKRVVPAGAARLPALHAPAGVPRAARPGRARRRRPREDRALAPGPRPRAHPGERPDLLARRPPEPGEGDG